MKAEFNGTFEEFDAFYKALKNQQEKKTDQVSFTFEVDDASQHLVEQHAQLSWIEEEYDENHVLHPNNRTWLLEKLDEAQADIDAGRLIPATPEFFQNIIAEGKARKAAKQ